MENWKNLINRQKLAEDKELNDALNLIINNNLISNQERVYLINNLWRLTYRQKPPTPEEFLTEDWIGPTANNVFPQVRDAFIEFFDPNKKHRHLYLSSCIGWGKSTLTTLIILYILLDANLMIDPKKYYRMAATGAIVAVLGSFSKDKGKQVLLKPFLNILLSSPRFRRVKQEERIIPAQLEEDNKNSGRIVWATSSSMASDIQFSNDLHVIVSSDRASLLGLNILCGALSELSFWVNRGVGHEAIAGMVNDLEGRIENRFPNYFYARLVIDSSPNSWDYILDKYVFSGEAERDEKNYVIKAKHWEIDIYHWKYPMFYKENKYFWVFAGNAGKESKIIHESQVKNFHPDEVIKMPEDLKSKYLKDPSKIIKDYAGYPSGSSGKLIENFNVIDQMFDNNLRNIYGSIIAPADKNPSRLIWDTIHNDFFIEVSNNYFDFYRAPREFRYFAVDQSESGDITGMSMVHPEINNKGEIIIVTDFNLAIKATKERINIDATGEFILDLARLGRIVFKGISFDQYQSSGNKQRVERELKLKITRSLADIDRSTYLVYVSWMKNKRIKTGKNIFLKNNLRSLHEIETSKGKKKIDHVKGQIENELIPGANWDTDIRGINAKDVSDSHSMACFMLINDYKGVPTYQWEDTYFVGHNRKGIKEQQILDQILSKYNLSPTVAY
jgi:hypothetical protein